MKYVFYFFLLFSVCSCRNTENSTLVVYPETKAFIESFILDGTVKAVHSMSVSCPRVYDVEIAYIVEKGTPVKKGDTVCILDNSKYISELIAMEDQQTRLRAEYSKLMAELSSKSATLESEFKNVVIQTSIHELDSLQLKYTSNVQKRILELEIKKAEIEKERLRKKLVAHKEISRTQIRQLKLRLQQTEVRLKSVKDKLNELILLAPQDGIAIPGQKGYPREDYKVGDLVYSRKELVRIPNLNEMMVLMQASESAYKRMRLGQKVHMTFDAMNGMEAEGEINFIARIGKPNNHASKLKSFEVHASVDSFERIPESGISASCEVLLAESAESMVVPQICVYDEDSSKFVYVLKNGQYIMKEVRLGLQSLNEVMIKEGLDSLDAILLQKPKRKVDKIIMLDS